MPGVPRSLLLAPANLGDVLRKMPKAKADLSVACLEDGTPPDMKIAARDIAAGALDDLRVAGWTGTMFVRCNAVGTEWFEHDALLAVQAGFDGLVVPMAERAADMKALADLLRASRLTRPFGVVVGVETGRGVLDIAAVLDDVPALCGVYFGAEDYAVNIGSTRTESNADNVLARSTVALHAAVRGVSAYDQGVTRWADDERFSRECGEARGYGYTGKICIHPRQVALANALFLPSATEVEWSRRVILAYEQALGAGRGAPGIDGEVIDAPLVERARQIVARNDAAGAEN
jgi:citrate lyase subunit beta/citryl-CoA lyase